WIRQVKLIEFLMTMKMSVLRLFSNHKYKAKSCLKEHDFALYFNDIKRKWDYLHEGTFNDSTMG
ncbi:TPA: hypothetical protein ACLBZ3_005606, partial [Bacillus cereus]